MAHTKQLLDEVNIDNVLDKVDIIRDTFIDEATGKRVEYNRVRLTLDNEDVVFLKPTKELKMALYYRLKQDEK